MNEITIPMSRAMKNVTLNVRVSGVHIWWVRQRLGIWLIVFAARVMGVGVYVRLEETFERQGPPIDMQHSSDGIV